MRKGPRQWTDMVSSFLGTGDIQQAKECLDRAPQWSASACDRLIAAYARKGQMQIAESIFARMEYRDIPSWTNMLVAASSAGECDRSKDAFDAMPQRDVVAWNAMLAAFAKIGDPEHRLLFQKMPRWSLPSWNILLTESVDSGQTNTAWQVFGTMPCRDAKSWTSMLQMGGLFHRQDIFRRMPSHDAVSLGAMLASYADAGLVAEARALFDGMPHGRGVVAWSTMVNGYISAARIEDAATTMARMPMVNVVSLGALLGAVAQTGDTRRAKAMFDGAPQRDAGMWNALFVALCKAGEVDSASRTLDKAPALVGLSWWTLLSKAAVDKGRIGLAKRTFDRMPVKDVVAWNTMVSGYSRTGHIREAEAGFEAMAGVGRDIVSWNIIVDGYAQNGRWAESVAAFRAMVLDGLLPDAVAFLCLLVSQSHIGNVAIAGGGFQSMLADFGLEATREHYCCVLDSLARSGRLDEAAELVDRMPFLPDHVAWRTIATMRRFE